MQVQPDNRPDLGADASVLPVKGVDAELVIDSVKECVVVSVGPDKQLADFKAVDGCGVVHPINRVHGKIESLLHPGRHAVGPFGSSVERVISDDGPREDGDSPSSGREVAVKHEIEYTRRLALRIIDLDLVGLRENGR